MNKKIILLGLIVSIPGYFKAAAQVNLQTGAAEYSIPLYSYADPNNRIGAAVSLTYTAGNGLKVSEIPSNVGTGWDINAGGFIQRIQHGEPDDQKNNITSYTYPGEISDATTENNFHNWVDNYYPNGYLYSEYSPTSLIDNGGGYTPIFSIANYKYKSNPKYSADLEQDVFAFNFNGRTGYFVIGKKDQNNVYPIRTLYDSKLKIEKVDGDLNNTNNIRTTISEFQITDESGIKYIFKDANLDQVCVYDKIDWYDQYGVYGGQVMNAYSPSGSVNITFYTYLNQPPQYNAISGNTKNSFVKNRWYLSEIINPLTGIKIQFIYETFDFDLQGNKTAQQTTSGNKATFSLMIDRLKGTAKRLKKIILSTTEAVEFNYSASSRIDMPADKALENITIKYGGDIKYQWVFEQGYFVKNEIKALNYNFTNEDKVWARLCLQKLKKTGAGNLSEPPYSFSYFMGNESDLLFSSAIPPIFSYYQDFWGYYNITRRGGFYNMATHTTAWGNSPYEPFGGNLLPREVYETSWCPGGSCKRPTLEARNGILKTVTNPLGGDITYSYESNYFDIPTSQGYGGIRVNKITSYDGLDHNNDIVKEYKYIKQDGSTSSWGYDNYIYSRNTNMRVYVKCGSNQKFPGVNIREFALGLAKTWIMNGITLSTTFSYVFSYATAQIQQILISVIVSIIIDLITPDYMDYSVSELSSNSYISHNLLPFQYSRVEVINKLLNDNIGKTVFEFTSPAESEPEYAIDIPSLSAPFSSRQRYGYWLYGLPRRITIYDKNSKIVKKTENYYQPFKYSLSNDPKFVSQTWLSNKRTFGCPFSIYTTSSSDIVSDIYYPICGRAELKYSKVYIYNSSSPQENAVTQTDYEYSPNNYLPNKVKSTNSKGELVETNTYYPQDYTLTGVIQTMKDNNIFNAPISSQTLITKSGAQKYVVSGNVSEFAIAGNGDIKVLKTHAFRNDQPLISTSVSFSGGQLIPNNYKETGSISYNTAGNAVQLNSDNGKISTIYDYDNKLPVASVVNADVGETAYSSFESDGTGGWEITPGSTIITTDGVTGKKSFSGTLIKNSLPVGNYTVTLWSLSSGTVTVNGQPGSTLVTNGIWRLYEWKLNNVTSVTVAADHIDEVRLYPSKARMNTSTYDPMIGKTSECDAANRISYYEYDDLGRLHFIRDQNRNILKMYEYNYKR
jgi:hypothetical protein